MLEAVVGAAHANLTVCVSFAFAGVTCSEDIGGGGAHSDWWIVGSPCVGREGGREGGKERVSTKLIIVGSTLTEHIQCTLHSPIGAS